jgi:hypothetical protein
MRGTPHPKRLALRNTGFRAFCGFALFCMLTGCGERPPKRAVVSGSVTYQGKPVEFGDIVFQPLSENAGKWFAQGKIVGGKYSLDAARGPLAGKNLVQIRGYRMTGRKRLDIAGKSLSEAPKMIDELVPYIPEEFNEASELTVEIKPGDNEHVNFVL